MPVMEDGELLGIVSIRDILWALVADTTVSEEEE
jgi:CBS domain-containing protein